jgi:hypothetical protein
MELAARAWLRTVFPQGFPQLAAQGEPDNVWARMVLRHNASYATLWMHAEMRAELLTGLPLLRGTRA